MTQPWPALLCALALAQGAPASLPATAPQHTCAWTFQGGSPASSSSCIPPPVTFSAPGPKKVTLKVCTFSCSSMSRTVVVADPRPSIIKITASPTTLYPGDTVALNAQVVGREPLTFSWTLPGNVTSSSNPVTFTIPPTAFRISLSLTVANASGSARRSIYLPVLDPRPRGTIRIAPSVPYQGDVLTASVEPAGRPPYAYRWTLLPDGVSSSSHTLVWDSSSAPAGSRRLQLSLTNASGTANLVRIFRLDPPPLALAFDPVCPNLCFFSPGQSISFNLSTHPRSPAPILYEYDWNGDRVFEDSSAVPLASHSYSTSGSFRPRVRLTAPGGRTQTLLSGRILFVSKPR